MSCALPLRDLRLDDIGSWKGAQQISLQSFFHPIHQCQSVMEAELQRLGVNYSPAPSGGTRELELAHHAIWESRVLLVFRFLALEASLLTPS